MPSAAQLTAELRRQADPERAKSARWFFKTAPGQYGYGDVFWGLTVPQVRATAKRFRELPAAELAKLLRHRAHEVRQAGLLVMMEQYRRGDAQARREAFELYLKLRRYVNNWDLVDLSAPKIVGAQLLVTGQGIGLLRRLAGSASVWDRRIAVLATFAFIDAGRHAEALEMARRLLRDRHDLIHKAVGWALREVGNRAGGSRLRTFLNRHAAAMPRTMLRYAIERLPERERQRYLRLGRQRREPHRVG